MRSLFVKIFVWFALAAALIVAAHAVSTILTEPDDGPVRGVEPSLVMFGTTAAEKYEREGKGALSNYLDLLGRTARIRGYLFDADGNEVSGREATPEKKEIAQRLSAAKEETFSKAGQTGIVARKVVAPSGKQFVMLGEVQRPINVLMPFSLHFLWTESAAMLLTAGVLCYLLARYLSSPVVKLRAATQQLAAGDLSARVGAANGRRRDELADLGRDFDVMAERIQSLMNSQQRLLHDISHELRSPLARLKIALELARTGDGPEAGWALDRIEREADRLNDLIGQLLTLARLDSKPPNRDGSVDLKRLVDEIVADADFEARSRDRAVKLVACQDCLIDGNEQLLRSAIENVVRNAASYTPVGTSVEVSLQCENGNQDERAVITVLDKGLGVPQAALSNIFHPFYRVADARDRQSGGSGLGLSITQRAVQIHGGSVSASNIPGGGLLVEILLPLTTREPARVS
jgi:two-component system sensor histidine kinase CpxA